MYVDAYALIVQRDADGGDTLQREGMYAFGKWLRYNRATNTATIEEFVEKDREPKQIMDRLEVKPGIYVRHPDPKQWYSNPNTTSRDQLVPVFAYCAAYQDYPRLGRLFWASFKRGFFAQNTIRAGDGKTDRKVPDTLLGHLSLFIRAGGYWTAPFYPWLLVTDSVNLAGTLLQQIPIHYVTASGKLRLKEPRDVDDNNSIIQLLMAAHFKPTPISWLNRQVYAYTRRPNLGNSVLGERNPVMGAMAWYHRAEAGGNPEMAELYRPLINEYFSPTDDYQRFRIHLTSVWSRFSERILARAN